MRHKGVNKYMEKEEPKICWNCKYARKQHNDEEICCIHPNNLKTDLSTGKKKIIMPTNSLRNSYRFLSWLHGYKICGRKAKWFEPRASKNQEIQKEKNEVAAAVESWHKSVWIS